MLLAASRDVEGMTALTFRLVGPLNQPGGVTFAGGEITVQHASLTHPSLPERLTEVQGRFVLSDGGTMFDQVTGHFGDLALRISGGITEGRSSAFQDFLIRITGDADHMARLLPSQAIPAGMIEGLVNGAVVLTGPTLSPHVRGEVVLTESKVTLPGLVEKPIGAQATVEFEGMIPQGSGVLFDRLELIVPPIRLPVKGKIQLGERFSIDAALSTGTLSLSRVPEWIAKGGFEAGNIELSLDMKGKGLDWKAWRTTGWLALTNGLMNAKGAEGPIQDLYLRVHFVKNGAEIKRLSFRLLDSDVGAGRDDSQLGGETHDYRQDRVQSDGSRPPHPERRTVADYENFWKLSQPPAKFRQPRRWRAAITSILSLGVSPPGSRFKTACWMWIVCPANRPMEKLPDVSWCNCLVTSRQTPSSRFGRRAYWWKMC